MKTIVINNPTDWEKVTLACDVFTEADCFPVDVIIRKHDTSILTAQRGQYWRWVTAIIGTTGQTKDEFHDYAKKKIFLNIYLADETDHLEFTQELVDNMKLIQQERPEIYPNIRDAVYQGVSHLDANKKNWHEVFIALEKLASKLSVKLPYSDKKGVMK
jgi:hypothetical protein